MADNENFADWLAICNVKAAYCRLLDAKDWDGWSQLFTEDVIVDTTDSGGEITRDRETFVKSVSAALAGVKTAHQIHAPEIRIEGDEAHVIWAMQDRLIWSEERTMTGYGHYVERYRKDDGIWRIAEQKLTRLIMES